MCIILISSVVLPTSSYDQIVFSNGDVFFLLSKRSLYK